MRWLVLFFLLSVPATVQAQTYRISPTGCTKPGETIQIEGRDFGRVAGKIRASGQGRARELQVSRWSPQQITVVVPPRGFRAGGTYRLVWVLRDGSSRSLGAITLCALPKREPKSAAPDPKPKPKSTRVPGGRAPKRVERAKRDTVPAPNGAPEYSVLLPAGQERAARAVLEDRGATLLRRRNLPQMGRVMLFNAFPPGLDLPEVRAALRIPAPDAAVDRHHIYGFAAPPRLYASALVGDSADQPCALPRAVRVGVIDGPVQAGHPALAGVTLQRHSVLSAGFRPAGRDHATAIVGLIAGTGAGGHMGMAPGSAIFAAEAFGRKNGREGARLEDIAAGLEWLRGRNVRLVNMSMSGAMNDVFLSLLARARAKGMVVIAAAGNDRSARARLPAASPDTIAVTAVDAVRRLYGKANTGAHIEFAAPGVDLWVISAKGGGYRSGSSFAAPFVTSLLARQAARGGLSLDKARRVLRNGAIDLGPVGRDVSFGHGLVQSGGC